MNDTRRTLLARGYQPGLWLPISGMSQAHLFPVTPTTIGEGQELSTLMADQNTDLERRVLAHERILKFLLSELTRVDPQLLDQLTLRFASQNHQAGLHDYVDADDYAERFIGEVRDLQGLDQVQGPRRAPNGSRGRAAHARPAHEGAESSTHSSPAEATVSITVRKRSGVWEVSSGQDHLGDYHDRARAIEAALTEAGAHVERCGSVEMSVEGRPFAITDGAAGHRSGAA